MDPPLADVNAAAPDQPPLDNVDPPPVQAANVDNDDQGVPPLTELPPRIRSVPVSHPPANPSDGQQVLDEFLRQGFYVDPGPTQSEPISEPTLAPATGDLAADQIAGTYETPQLRPAQTPFETPDMPQPSGFWIDPEVEAFAAQLAEAMTNGRPLPRQASQTEEWTTHYTRQQEREDRDEWGPMGPQQAQWQERWDAAQENPQENAQAQGQPLSLDELAQGAANRLWRVQQAEADSGRQQDAVRPPRSLADLPPPAEALPHYQPPISSHQPGEDAAEEEATFTDWRDAPPMTLEERLTAATSYGGRFFICFSCVELCNICGNFYGHRQYCQRNDPSKHGRESHSQLFWLRDEGKFVWPYDDHDWREFLPGLTHGQNERIQEVTSILVASPGVEWRPDVWRGAGAVSRRGGYVVSPHLLRDAIHRESPPFVIHCSGLSGRNKTTPTLQMNGRPSFNAQWYNGIWFHSFCVSWNQLNKSWEDFRRFEEGATHFCPCPKRRGTCLNEERCSYVWCDRWDSHQTICPTAVWHKDNEDMFLF